MATTRPLKLTRASYSESAAQYPAVLDPFARVLVDVPTSSISDVWDYLVPEELSESCNPGALVRVPFGGKILEGIVLTRTTLGEATALKFIDSILSRIHPIAQSQRQYLPEIAARYGCNQSQLLTSIFPAFSKSGEKGIEASSVFSDELNEKRKLFSQLRIVSADSTLHDELMAVITDNHFPGKKTFIFPDLNELQSFQRLLHERGYQPLILHASLSKSERYRNYLLSNNSTNGVILTLRSGAFLSSGIDDLMIAIDDVLPEHYERRSPSWNTRDILLLRSQQTNILFLCHTPSLELVRLVDLGWLEHRPIKRPSKQRRVIAEERSPESSYHPIISQGLKNGSVLVIHNAKGFINSFTCSQCRNIALCDCGGKLTLQHIADIPECSICKKRELQWKCRWCNSVKPRIAAKGLHYSARELAASFPRTSVIISTADHRIDSLPEGNNLVLSTTGCEPRGSYQAIVYLSADRDFSSAEMRSQERTRNHWAQLLTLLASFGTIFLEMPSTHAAVQDLLKGDPFVAARKEIIERDELYLPPNNRLIAIYGESTELQRITPLLVDERLIFVGPFSDDQSRSKIVVKVAHDQAQRALSILVSANKVQAAKGRAMFSLHVDPVEL